MANTKLKFKTGTIDKLAQKDSSNNPTVAFEEGTVYFAVDTSTDEGRIAYDVKDSSNNKHRIVIGADIDVDDTLSTSSTNPVQNNTVTNAINSLTQNKQDNLTAGDNITIDNGTISATDQGPHLTTVTNVSIAANSFSQISSGYPTYNGVDYPYRASYTNNKIKSTTIVTMIASAATGALQILCNENDSYNGGVYVYASSKPAAAVTFDVVYFHTDTK